MAHTSEVVVCVKKLHITGSARIAFRKGTKKGLRVTETAGLPLIQTGLDWWRVMQIPIITVFVHESRLLLTTVSAVRVRPGEPYKSENKDFLKQDSPLPQI